MSQCCPNSGRKLTCPKWLCQIIISACVKDPDRECLGPVLREHKNGQRSPLRPNLRNEGNTIPFTKRRIDDQNVRFISVKRLKELVHTLEVVDSISLPGERCAQQPSNSRVFIHHQNSCAWRRVHSSRLGQ